MNSEIERLQKEIKSENKVSFDLNSIQVQQEIASLKKENQKYLENQKKLETNQLKFNEMVK